MATCSPKVVADLPKLCLLIVVCFYLATATTSAQPRVATPENLLAKSEIMQLALELDDGKKWRVDQAMMVHFRQMEADLKGFQGVDPEAYRALGERLQASLDRLVSGCTMQGPAHDQLHQWLVPFMEKVQRFSRETDPEDSKRQLQQLRDSFRVFHAHFQ